MSKNGTEVSPTKKLVLMEGTEGVWDFKRKLPDLTLVVEDEEYHVHKEVLTEVSPVFKVMLESKNFRENFVNEIELPGKKKEDIQQLLNVLYLSIFTKPGNRIFLCL